MNLVMLCGNLGADIETKTSGDTTYAHFSVATSHRVRRGDDWVEKTTWTRVTAFQGLAKSLRILGKGSRVLVKGRLKTSRFDRDGVVFHYSEVIADEVEFQVVKPLAGESQELPEEEADEPGEEPGGDDIPF
jgi:single-strand DNA-binding protein